MQQVCICRPSIIILNSKFLHRIPKHRCRRSSLIFHVVVELIAAPWPGEREIFSFGNMASRSSARLENLPLTRNVVAKLSAPDDDKEDGRSFDATKGKTAGVIWGINYAMVAAAVAAGDSWNVRYIPCVLLRRTLH